MKSLSKHLVNYKNRLGSIQKGACKNISTLIVTRTPVDTGQARKSWTPSTGSVKTGGNSSQILNIVGSLKLGETYNFASSLPYIRRLEYEGHSQQAPNGMFRRSVAEWNRIVKEEARKARGS